MEFLNDIFQSINENINWTIFCLVIGIGYGVRFVPIANQIRKTIRIVIVTLLVTGFVAWLLKINAGIFFASYFMAIGFHSAIIKLVEEKLQGKNILFTKSDFIGSRPNDR